MEFVTDTGVIVSAVSAAEMLEVDRIAVQETGPNLFQMMENAGRNLASFAVECLEGKWKRARVLVLAGPGGNGGGGICAARHLANHGVNVAVCLLAPDKLGQVPAFQRQVYRATAGREIGADELSRERPDLVVDAIFGYSLSGPPRGAALEMILWANGAGAPVLALDIPSGVDATTGETPGECVQARWTMTLALPKTGLVPDLTGEVELADIGIPEGAYRRMGLAYCSPFDHRYRVPLTAAAKTS
jgi:NAD(P)H-hydrate epimerase